MKSLTKNELVEIHGGGYGFRRLGELIGSYAEWCKRIVPRSGPKNYDECVEAFGDNMLLWP